MTTLTSTTAATTPAQIEYRPAIDGLRAVAVLAVFIFHLNHHWLPGGFVGVDIFFVISGYLITSIIYSDCEQNRFSYGRFYQRRISRLLPTFFTVAMTTILAASFIYSRQDLASAGATLSAAAASIANLKFMMQGNYFVLSPDAQPFLHCWSLSVEEQFYLFFPAIFLFVHRRFRKHRVRLLGSFCAVSFFFCIAIAHVRPSWAFYLLPTRAWELITGSIFAGIDTNWITAKKSTAVLPLVGLTLVIVSFVVISDSQQFPGYLATLPVVGTACFLFPFEHSATIVSRLLSWKPFVLIGRLSYSLYLWHWPVFSLVDYKLYSASPISRLILKIVLSAIATIACFVLIERPARKFLNKPSNRGLAYSALITSLIVVVPLGLVIRNANYVSASMRDVTAGGMHFNESAPNGSIILMGDSNASMYGTMVRDVAKELGLRLTVISVDGGDLLPYSSGNLPPLWTKSLAVIEQQRPEFAVIACLWSNTLRDDEGRLDIALNQLKQNAQTVILITQPPALPKQANRQGIREGNRPPFVEDLKERAERIRSNEIVQSEQEGNVKVINIEPLFSDRIDGIRFEDSLGRQLYQDADHLSAVGAELVKADLVKEILSRKSGLRKP